LFRYGLGLAMSSIYRAVAIVRLRGRPPPRPVSPPAAAAGTTVHHVTGIISEVSIREPSSSCSSPAAAAGGIAPAGHGIESIGRGEIVLETRGTAEGGRSRSRSAETMRKKTRTKPTRRSAREGGRRISRPRSELACLPARRRGGAEEEKRRGGDRPKPSRQTRQHVSWQTVIKA